MKWNIRRRLVEVPVIAVLLGMAMFSMACNFDPNFLAPKLTAVPQTAVPQQNLTPTQASSLVASCITAAASYSVRSSAGYYQANYRSQSGQWIVTTWPTKEDSEQYLGHSYIVDDASGKVLNCPS